MAGRCEGLSDLEWPLFVEMFTLESAPRLGGSRVGRPMVPSRPCKPASSGVLKSTG